MPGSLGTFVACLCICIWWASASLLCWAAHLKSDALPRAWTTAMMSTSRTQLFFCQRGACMHWAASDTRNVLCVSLVDLHICIFKPGSLKCYQESFTLADFESFSHTHWKLEHNIVLSHTMLHSINRSVFIYISEASGLNKSPSSSPPAPPPWEFKAFQDVAVYKHCILWIWAFDTCKADRMYWSFFWSLAGLALTRCQD